MVWLKSVTCITACILLVQSTLAVPLKNDRPLIKRGSGLSGKFLHITGN